MIEKGCLLKLIQNKNSMSYYQLLYLVFNFNLTIHLSLHWLVWWFVILIFIKGGFEDGSLLEEKKYVYCSTSAVSMYVLKLLFLLFQNFFIRSSGP